VQVRRGLVSCGLSRRAKVESRFGTLCPFAVSQSEERHPLVSRADESRGLFSGVDRRGLHRIGTETDAKVETLTQQTFQKAVFQSL
jgi:hypothetical protein